MYTAQMFATIAHADIHVYLKQGLMRPFRTFQTTHKQR